MMTIFLRDSPLEIHRKLYQENVVKRGGSYGGSLIPPPDIFDKIMAGEAFSFQIHDGLANNKHRIHMLEEEVTFGPTGYYFRLHLPIAKEIMEALWHFRDAGIIQKVLSCVTIELIS